MTNSNEPTASDARRRWARWGWSLLLMIAGFSFYVSGLIETTVAYSPWLLEQAEEGNIEFLSIQGTRIRGRLRSPATFHDPEGRRTVEVRLFTAGLPSTEAVRDMVDLLDERAAAGDEPTRILWEPPPMGWGAALGFAALAVLVLFIPVAATLAYWAGHAGGYRLGRSTVPPPAIDGGADGDAPPRGAAPLDPDASSTSP